MIKSREIRLKSRPTGRIVKDNFELATVDVPAPADDEVLVKNLWMSIDAGQRTLMGGEDRNIMDLPPKRFELGKPMDGQAVGQVIESRKAGFLVGTYVTSNFGWREYFTFGGKPDRFVLNSIPSPVAPLQTYLHVNSVYGAGAYFSLTEAARVKAGETVWISTAAGNSGSIACQIAKISGCRVVGTTGSDAKVAWLRDELTLDAAINYKKVDSLRAAVKAACPDGVDVYLDYVGGEHLEAAIDLMNPHGRIIVIGQTQHYDGGVPIGPKNVFSLVLKRLRVQGFTVFDYLESTHMAKFEKLMGRWMAEGKITWKETVYEGIENAVQAQIDLFQGKNVGKMLVKLADL